MILDALAAQAFLTAWKLDAKAQPDVALKYGALSVTYAPPRNFGRIEEGAIEELCWKWRIKGESAWESDVLLALQGETDADRERRKGEDVDALFAKLARNNANVKGHVLSGRKAL
jgi:hypothetical protein